MPADDLIRLVETLHAPYGLERSVKIVPGDLLDDRCLISLHRNALGPRPLIKLREFTEALGMPAGGEAEFADAFADADVVHFGHEAGGAALVRKVYFEFAARARRAMHRREPALVHLAYKWSPGRAGSLAIARYVWAPCRNRVEASARLAEILPAGSTPRASRAALQLLAQVSALADSGELPMMEVLEDGNSRRSCDINVYDADLRLSDVEWLEASAREFAVPASRFEQAFAGAGQSPLGHLSAGIGRDGQEFVTIYHGIEAR